jgi:Flp pilus assembly protein TadD
MVSRWDMPALLLPIGVALVIYLPNLPTSFVGMDWGAYRIVLETRNYLDVAEALFTDFQGRVVLGYYAPIGSISLMLDKWFAGTAGADAYSTCLINLLLHCFNGVCLFALLKVIEASPLVCGATVFFFLAHPVQVSSVMWFAERKTLLGGVFYFLCIACYLASRRYDSARLLRVSLGLFALSVLTKPVSLVLPAVLVASEALLPLPRLRKREPPCEDATTSPNESQLGPSSLIRRVLPLRELVRAARPLVSTIGPFVPIAVVTAGLTLFTERTDPRDSLPLLQRFLNLGPVLWFYLTQLTALSDMMFIYPAPPQSTSYWDRVVPFLKLLPVIAFILVRFIRRDYLPVWGYWAFILALIPALGLVPFGWLRLAPVADHFMYLSLFGIGFALACDLETLIAARKSAGRAAIKAFGAGVGCFLMFQTWTYAGHWRTSEDLWGYHVSIRPDCAVARYELGRALGASGRSAEAVGLFETAIEMAPRFGYPHNGLGVMYERLGDMNKAVIHYRNAVELMPGAPEARRNLANALLRQGKLDEAIEQFQAALALQPYCDTTAADLGAALLMAKRFPEAADAFGRAVSINGNKAEYHNGLGVALAELNHKLDAARHFVRALRIDPSHAGARSNLNSLGIGVAKPSVP